MRLSIRLPALATAVLAGLTLAATGPAAVSAAPARARGTTAGGGTRLWEARFTSGGRGAFGSAAAPSPDGSVLFAAGAAAKKVQEAGGIPTEGTVLAYHAGTGTVLWRASYNPSQLSTSSFYGLAVSPGGSAVYATGGTAPASGQSAATVTVAYNAATGAPIWTYAPGTPGPGGSVDVSPNGSTVFVANSVNSHTGPNVVALNAATGAVRWTATVGTGSAIQVVVSPDGTTVFVLAQGLLAAYNAATGAPRWTASPAQITPVSIALSPDGSKVIVTGLNFNGMPTDLRVVAVDAANGATLWSRQYKGPGGASSGWAAAVSPDSGTVYVSGYTRVAGVSNTYIVAVWAYNAATGASVWQRALPAFTEVASEEAVQMAVSPDGSKIFLATSAQANSAGAAFSAAALDPATGAKLWAHGSHVSGNNWHSFSSSLAVSPDGSRIYVTGTVNSPTPNQIGSMATVAYSS